MGYIYRRSLRIISGILLVFFTWSFGGVFDIAYAVKDSSQLSANTQQRTSKDNQQTKKETRLEEKFGKDIEEIGNILSNVSMDADTKKTRIKAKKAEIDADDVEIKKQFKVTEDKIQNLPEIIKQRHRDFVKKYDDNLQTLRTNLDDIDRAKTNNEKDLAQKKAKDFLDKVKPPKKHQALDPNKLPNRTEEPVFKEPRTKPEEFQRDSAQQLALSNQPNSPNPSLAKRGTGAETKSYPTLAKGGVGGFSGQGAKPILIASNGSLSGLLSPDSQFTNNDSRFTALRDFPEGSYQIALANPPTAADLAETIEVKFTPAITAKAAELGNNPVKIYEWVRNNIEYVPTYGSIQGADMCLQTKLCNDFDTASLLISMLRVSGIHARYVYGTIELPIERVKNWVGGFTDSIAALNLMATGRIPVGGITEGGKIVTVRKEQIWVEAFIDYFPSRGARHKNGKGSTWIPLDASFKQHTYTQGIDIKSAVPVDAQSFLNQVQSSAAIDQIAGNVTNVDPTLVRQKMQDYQTQVQDYIIQNYPTAVAKDIFGGKDIVQQNFPYLLGTLPYKTVAVGARHSTVPDSMRHKITFIVNDDNELAVAQPLTVTRSLAEIAGKRVTLNYLPAQASDAAALEYYGYYSTPPYLVNVRPVLFIEGAQVASGDPVGMGSNQSLAVAFSAPNRSTETVAHPLSASAMVAIGLDLQKITPDMLSKRNAMLQSAFSKIGKEEVSIDDLIGEVLNVQALSYLYTHEIFNSTAAGTNIVYTKQPEEMAVMINPVVEYLYGIPYLIRTPTTQFDVARYVMARKSLSGDRNQEISFTFLTGLLSSALEHGLFDLTGSNSKAISTVKALSIANESGIPIYRINSSNSSDILPKLQVLPDTLQNVRNAIASGKEVIIPERTIQYYQWVGDGYLILDPSTGAASYLISGGLMGGSNACDVATVWKLQSYSTLSGAAEYCENHAVPITGWLVGIKNQLIKWNVQSVMNSAIASKLGSVVVGIGALVAALITVARNLDKVQSPLGRALLFDFTFCASVLSWWLTNWIFLNFTNPIAGTVAAIAMGFAVIEITDYYVAQVKALFGTLSYYVRRREIEV